MRSVLNWEAVLIKHRIPFITHGKNVKRGNLNVHCPFCGSADPSQHMGIDPDTGWWACWRNDQHRGKSPVRLLMRLVGMDYAEAREACGLGEDYVDPDGFSAFMNKLRSPELLDDAPAHLEWPEDASPIRFNNIRTRRHWAYLCGPDRRFTAHECTGIVQRYDLRASLDPLWRDRVLMPYYEDNKLVAWTGRAITGNATLRYRDLAIEDCVVPIKHTFFNAEAMKRRAKGLLLVEGPFDAVKADFHGHQFGIRAVALSTASLSDQQLYRLSEHASNFGWIGVCMDQSSALDALASTKMVGKLSHLKTPIKTIRLPESWHSKDFGGATGQQVTDFLSTLTGDK